MTQADRDALVAAAQVLLREGDGGTFDRFDTGHEHITHIDIAEELFILAGWKLGDEYRFPELPPREGPCISMTEWYREQLNVAYTSPADNVRLVGVEAPTMSWDEIRDALDIKPGLEFYRRPNGLLAFRTPSRMPTASAYVKS